MTNELVLTFDQMQHPLPNDPRSAFQNWGWMRFTVRNQSGNVLLTLIDNEWDIYPLFSWLSTNRERLLSEKFPEPVVTGASLSISIAEFYRHVDPFDFERLDRMFEYRSAHGLRFALRGTEMCDAYIGANNAIHTISSVDKTLTFDYNVDLSGFFEKHNSLI